VTETDRELLKLAAKAIEHEVVLEACELMSGVEGAMLRGVQNPWSPLTDDGDEARLEAALQLHVEWHPMLETVTVGTSEIGCTEPYASDRQRARRLAGVRAAAEIGRSLK
jgi:hypothetical protein